jgi:hypothetical protein
MSSKDTLPIDTANAIEENPNPPSRGGRGGRGGRGSRQKRNDQRRQQQNFGVQSAIQSNVKLELGLSETTSLSQLSPATSNRPGGVHVNLLGLLDATYSMLYRFRAIAQRPLALQLTDANINVYRKIVCYGATLRISAAQNKVPYVVGCVLELKSQYTSDEVRLCDGNFRIIPNFLAWLLANVGTTTVDGQQIVPLLPSPPADEVTAETAMSGNFSQIVAYVHAHGAAGHDIPEADRPIIARLAQVLPALVRVANGARFNQAAVAFWVNPEPAQWAIFTDINASINEQKLAVNEFVLSSALGSPQQTVRFPLYTPPFQTTSYYSLSISSMTEIRAAIVLRSGVDEFLPQEQLRHRFIGDPTTALMHGSDIPEIFIQAQLTMLSKLELVQK